MLNNANLLGNTTHEPEKIIRTQISLWLYSQEKPGMAAGIDEFTARNRVSKYEAGRNSPSFALAQEFARVLDVPVCYLYIMEDDFAEAVLQLYRQQQAPVLENKDNVQLKKVLLRVKTVEQLTNEVVTITSDLVRKPSRNKIEEK